MSEGKSSKTPSSQTLKEGLSILEYFISTHGREKDSQMALKTADAGV